MNTDERVADRMVAEQVFGLTVLTADGSQWADYEQCAMPVGEPYTVIHDARDPEPTDPDSRRAWTDTCRVDEFHKDPAADYSVLVKVLETWTPEALIAFRTALRELWASRDDPHFKVNEFVVLDGGRYEPGDYSRAALAALAKEKA